jgi:hypothetical protein
MTQQSGIEKLCTTCYAVRVPHERSRAGFVTCLRCGEQAARKVRHTIVPMHKSNYVVVSDPDDVRGINNKGGFYR